MFTIALTVETAVETAVSTTGAAAGGPRRDVVARASGTQTVHELILRLAQYLGLATTPATLFVRRTGERLDPTTPLAEADLLEGDVVVLGA